MGHDTHNSQAIKKQHDDKIPTKRGSSSYFGIQKKKSMAELQIRKEGPINQLVRRPLDLAGDILNPESKTNQPTYATTDWSGRTEDHAGSRLGRSQVMASGST